MLRFGGSLLAATRVASAHLAPAVAHAARAPVCAIMAPAWSRSFASHIPKAEITERILSVVKNFQNVDAQKVTPQSHFTKDLGLDSLDTVEIVMAFEDEFAIEIPDAEAEKIQTVAAAIDYIGSHPQAK